MGKDDDDAILSEDSMDSTVLGIVDRCRKEEDNFIKAKRPVRYSVKRRVEANLDTSDEEEKGEITSELRSRNRKTRILEPESEETKRAGLIYDLIKDDNESLEGNPPTVGEKEENERKTQGKEGPYKTIGRLGIEYGPPPENFKYEELNKMQVTEVGTLALDWISETNAIRGKSDLQGKSSGDMKSRLNKVREVIIVLMAKVREKGDPAYWRKKSDEFGIQSLSMERKLERLENDLDEHKLEVDSLMEENDGLIKEKEGLKKKAARNRKERERMVK